MNTKYLMVNMCLKEMGQLAVYGIYFFRGLNVIKSLNKLRFLTIVVTFPPIMYIFWHCITKCNITQVLFAKILHWLSYVMSPLTTNILSVLSNQKTTHQQVEEDINTKVTMNAEEVD